MRSPDTHPEAHDVQIRIYRRMGPERRAEVALELSEQVRRVSETGIRLRHPEYTDEEVRRALLVLLHGADIVRRMWPGSDPPSP